MSARPRVNYALLKEYIDSSVTLTGMVDSVDGSEIHFKLNDKTVSVMNGAGIPSPELGGIYEIVGKAMSPDTVRAYKISKLAATSLPPAGFEQRLLNLREGAAKRTLFNVQ